ncbi:hypothetical protein SDC9_207041 [bioreactor metagenome]|uniref:Uncharacterized protein n=1 Tax=bioreactor metagenome TaxID=1076179 RepID=A0A645J849_9ZZZZ
MKMERLFKIQIANNAATGNQHVLLPAALNIIEIAE